MRGEWAGREGGRDSGDSGKREEIGAISGKVIVRNHDSNLSLHLGWWWWRAIEAAARL